MKKFFAVFLSFVLVFLQFIVVAEAAYDETDCVSLDEFRGDFIDLLNDCSTISGFEDMQNPLYSDNSQTEDATTEENGDENETLRLIVKCDDKLDSLDSVGYIYGYNDLHILQFDNFDSYNYAYNYYSSLETVEYVEDDSIIHDAAIDDGIVFESVVDYPTSVNSNIFGYTSAKNNSEGGNPVDIAVVDSGVQYDHDFLQGRVVDSGFNAISDNGTSYDDRGHGTHVAGIIVANTLSNVTVHSYKVLDSNGEGTVAQVSLGIAAAIEDDVDLINLSLSMMGESETLHEAVTQAYDAGITVIVSAGNKGMDLEATYYSPGCFDEVISVMSCTNKRYISSFSNYGTPCDFAAPGENILSTWINNTYKISSGTSMAAPFICAAASYELAVNSDLTPDEVYTALSEKTEWCYGTPRGKCVYPDTKVTVSGKASTPVLNVNSCCFIGNMEISISCSDLNADVFYSFDDDPVLYEYTEPVIIDKTCTVNVFAVVDGKYHSASVSATYTLLESDGSEFAVDDNETLIEYSGASTTVTVPSFIYGKKISSVCESAFSNNLSIESVVFGNSLTEIGENAFIGCSNLTQITAPNLKTIDAGAFEECDSLTIIKSSTIETIGDRAFYGCDLLNSFTSLNNVTSVGISAFENTSALNSLIFNKIILIDDCAFKNSSVSGVTISNASEIGDYSFYNCDNIKTLYLSEALSFGKGAFENCDNLTTISAPKIASLPDSCFKNCVLLSSLGLNVVQNIGAYAFYGCESLSSFSFTNITDIGAYSFCKTSISSLTNNIVKAIGSCAFNDCSNINTVTLGALENIDFSVFYGCSAITKFSFNKATDIVSFTEGLNKYFPSLYSFIAPKLLSIPDNFFKDCAYLSSCTLTSAISAGENAFNGAGLTSISLDSLQTVGDAAFVNMGAVTSISLPNLSEFDASSFNCSNLTYLNIGVTTIDEGVYIKDIFPVITEFTANKLTSVPSGLFTDCTTLKKISLSKATDIAAQAFLGCSSLNKINLSSVFNIGEEAFKNCNISELYFSAKSVGLNAFDGNPLKVAEIELLSIECDFFGSSKTSVTELYMNCTKDICDDFTFEGFTSLEIIEMMCLSEIKAQMFKNNTSLFECFFDEVQTVGEEAFAGCSSLEYVYVYEATSIGSNAFYGCTALRMFVNSRVEKLDTGIFASCENLESLCLYGLKEIPVLEDGSSYFSTLPKLAEFRGGDIPEIIAHAFEGCSELASVKLGDVLSVEHHAFYGCKKLESVSFDSVENIGDFAFYNSGLSSFELPNVKNIGSYAFSRTQITDFSSETVESIDKYAFANCPQLTNVELRGITEIPEGCFISDTALESAYFSGIEYIGVKAFKNCSVLKSISLGSCMRVLDDEAFYGCTNIIALNNKVSSIGSRALYGCASLGSVLELPELLNISSDAFDGYSCGTLILENVETVYDTPDNATVLIGTDIEEFEIPTDSSSVIYSPAGTVASTYCINNNLNYFEFNEKNAILTNTPKYMKAYGEQYTFDIIGFNINNNYKWYGCNEADGSDAVKLSSYYNYFTPLRDNVYNYDINTYKYFFCVAQSNENGNVLDIKSNLIRNTFACVDTLSENNTIDHKNAYIYSVENSTEEFFGNMYFDEACNIKPSTITDNSSFYGTGTVIDVCFDDETAYSYTVILEGDINGDGYIDALDCAFLATVTSGKATIDDVNYSLAASRLDGTEGISINDYQAIVNKAVS